LPPPRKDEQENRREGREGEMNKGSKNANVKVATPAQTNEEKGRSAFRNCVQKTQKK
jgi:hypothetical protein